MATLPSRDVVDSCNEVGRARNVDLACLFVSKYPNFKVDGFWSFTTSTSPRLLYHLDHLQIVNFYQCLLFLPVVPLNH